MLTHEQLDNLRKYDLVTCCDDTLPEWWEKYCISLAKSKLAPPVWGIEKDKQYKVWYVPKTDDAYRFAYEKNPDDRFLVIIMPNGYRKSFRAKYFSL